jgi:hypothetical protein
MKYLYIINKSAGLSLHFYNITVFHVKGYAISFYMKISLIDDFISSDLKDLNYYTKDYHKNDVEEFEKKFINLHTNINSNNNITSSLIMNLAGELIYCYPNFNEHIGECYTIDELYEKCKGFIKEYTFTDSKDNKEKNIFKIQ